MNGIDLLNDFECFNRSIVELKGERHRPIALLLSGFNRSIVELKVGGAGGAGGRGGGFNRSIVELKDGFTVEFVA